MIADIIKPIKLLKGSHADTGTTGQGCFLNVISFLNGELQITDNSPCVCIIVKPIAIFLNDFLKDEDRNLMITYIEPAMGSVTHDKIELVRRANLVALFANKCSLMAAAMSAKAAAMSAKDAAMSANSALYAKTAAKYAAEYADKTAAKSARYCEYGESAATYAMQASKYAARSAAKSAEYYAEIKAAAFEFLDAALPKQVINDELIINRAKQLCELSA